MGTVARYQKLSLYGKALVCFIAASQIALATIFIMLGADQIFQFLYDSAQKLKAMPAGWAVLSAAIGGDYAQGYSPTSLTTFTYIVIVSIPPLVGKSTVITVCGFAYGVKAFSFVAPAACIGAAFTFICLRCFFHERVRRYTRNKEHWRALEAVVATKGLPLVVLIRLAPIPWTYSNALFASIESVRFWQFMVATVVYTPKLFVMVFIASRVAKFSDGQQRSEMDSTTKWINGLSIVLGASIAFAAGWLVWRLTDSEMRKMKALPQDLDDMAVDTLYSLEVGVPLPGEHLSDDLNGNGALRLDSSSDNLSVM
ncbi:SNARE associated Golgi protein [Rhizoctonia solani]|uniref:Golgi apparatus membrane protein TVP38 n=1 Tax=Rhizoctonia solani TaxID=456999 RepID=A0A8H7HG86_9AGAM|nr:SNARE associated Golgi protein [Rhizoctonia solani]